MLKSAALFQNMNRGERDKKGRRILTSLAQTAGEGSALSAYTHWTLGHLRFLIYIYCRIRQWLSVNRHPLRRRSPHSAWRQAADLQRISRRGAE